MNWFLIALIGPILWAIVNHIDKYLLSDKFKGSNVGALMLFSTLLSIVLLPVLYIIDPNIFNTSTLNILILIIVGILSGLAIMPYMYALDSEETSIVIPLFQLIPIWGYLFAYMILGETLTNLQLFGCFSIILGSLILTLEEDADHHIKFKRKVIWLMLLSTVLFAFYETLFKFAVIETAFIIATFWEYIGLSLLGIILFIFFKKYRTGFIYLLKTQGKKIFSLNIGSETLTVIGNITTNFALTLAPVTLVLTVNSLHPPFVFIIGIILTMLFPKIYQEKLSKKHLLQKTIAILVIIVGSILINK